ncbi:hypothetical protein FS749_011820 [Ceratobasidium sp. UAMH 11750]|nr:hypothetical protein FS749_011820 [Ceratobasidium sp. UAMH 11750]
MDEDALGCARKKARRDHLDISSPVPCYRSRCNGAQQIPRTRRGHLRQARERAAAVGIPAAGPSGTRSSSRRPPSLESPPPPSSPAWSLRSGGSYGQQPTPEVQRLLPEARGDDESDGSVSHLVARAKDFDVENKAKFFAQLLTRNKPNAGLELEALANAEDIRSPEGSDLGLDDVNFGIPDAKEETDEPPRFNLQLGLFPAGCLYFAILVEIPGECAVVLP